MNPTYQDNHDNLRSLNPIFAPQLCQPKLL